MCLPADGTTAACVAPPGIRRFPSAAANKIIPARRSPKRTFDGALWLLTDEDASFSNQGKTSAFEAFMSTRRRMPQDYRGSIWINPMGRLLLLKEGQC